MMASSKKYVPMDLKQAEEYLYAPSLRNADVVDVMEDGEKLIYAELLKLHERIDEIENQANEMMSPEKMSELAAGFLGGGS